LLFPYSCVSFCQVGQNERNLLLVIVINRFVHFEVNKYVLHEEDEIASFPIEGFWWVQFNSLESLRGCGFFGHSIVVSFVVCFGIVFRCCRVKVSRCRFLGVSKFRCIRVSWCQSVGVRCKDTGAVVGKTTLLLDFETLRLNV
jgi:hypothetical protein